MQKEDFKDLSVGDVLKFKDREVTVLHKTETKHGIQEVTYSSEKSKSKRSTSNWLRMFEDCILLRKAPVVPVKKRYWRWIISSEKYGTLKTWNFIDDNGFTTDNNLAFDNWKNIKLKIKQEKDFFEV
jgi:hypothetical protein